MKRIFCCHCDHAFRRDDYDYEEERWFCDVDDEDLDFEYLKIIDKFAEPCEKFNPREE